MYFPVRTIGLFKLYGFFRQKPVFSTWKKLYVKFWKNLWKVSKQEYGARRKRNGRENRFNDSQEKYYTRSDFLLLLQLEVLTKEICFSCWQSQVLSKELDSFYSWICGSKLIPNLSKFYLERVRNELAAGLLKLCKGGLGASWIFLLEDVSNALQRRPGCLLNTFLGNFFNC